MIDQDGHIMTFSDQVTHTVILSRRKRRGMYPERNQKNTSTTQHARNAADAVPAFWELETLLQQNDVHPRVQRELLEAQASAHAFVSWVLYVASP